jgi:hypothetical protein
MTAFIPKRTLLMPTIALIYPKLTLARIFCPF